MGGARQGRDAHEQRWQRSALSRAAAAAAEGWVDGRRRAWEGGVGAVSGTQPERSAARCLRGWGGPPGFAPGRSALLAGVPPCWVATAEITGIGGRLLQSRSVTNPRATGVVGAGEARWPAGRWCRGDILLYGQVLCLGERLPTACADIRVQLLDRCCGGGAGDGCSFRYKSSYEWRLGVSLHDGGGVG